MMAQNAPNGRSVMPESIVSSTTENAPSCSVSTQPSTGRERDLEAVRHPLTAPRKAAAAHQRPIDEKISDEAAVKRHVPDVRAQRHQAAVGKEQALDRKDYDHGQKSRPRPEHGREQQAAAEVAGRAGAGMV